MPRALITGITGQDGVYLSRLLLAKGYEVHGLVRRLDHPRRALLGDVVLHRGDLTDMSALVSVLRSARADEIYNLAAESSVADSWEHAHRTTDVTARGVLNLLEAIRRCYDDLGGVRFYQASSSEMFGKAVQSPQHERTLLWPRSPYGVSKVFGHHITVNYRESYGIHASSGILFNHESPLRGERFVTRKVSRAVARISLGLQDELVLGNLDVERDWGFAGDYVEAMWLMLQQPVGDDYVVATGRARSVRELVDIAFRHVGIDDWDLHVRQDKQLMRPAEVDRVVGDASKAHEELGWRPRVGFEDLVAMMVDADLERQRRAEG